VVSSGKFSGTTVSKDEMLCGGFVTGSERSNIPPQAVRKKEKWQNPPGDVDCGRERVSTRTKVWAEKYTHCLLICERGEGR